MKLCNKKLVIINEKEMYIDVLKVFDITINIDYHVYKTTLYDKRKIFGITLYNRLWGWNTYWLNYTQYYGDIDKVILESINHYLNNLKEQKYIIKNESKFINSN